ncbi:MAG: transglutaminase-like domain-containing protein [Thermoproteota archaeon]
MFSRSKERFLTWIILAVMLGLIFFPTYYMVKEANCLNENLMFTNHITYNYTEVETFQYTGSEKEVTLTWVVPPNTSWQICKVLSVKPTPDGWYHDEWGNLLCNVTVSTSGSRFNITGIYNVSSFALGKNAVQPSKVGGINQIPEGLIQNYSAPSYWWNHTHPEVKSMIDEIKRTNDHSNSVYPLVVQARNSVVQHLTYKEYPERHGATWAAINGSGDCEEYTDLFIAIVRGLGIPARRMTGFHVELKGNQTEHQGHAWPEVWLPGYGWIPYEVTSEDDGNSLGQISYHYVAYNIEGWRPPPSSNVSMIIDILDWNVSLKPVHRPYRITMPWSRIILITATILLTLTAAIIIAKILPKTKKIETPITSSGIDYPLLVH